MTLDEIMNLSEPAFQRLFRKCLMRLWSGQTAYGKGNFLAHIAVGKSKVFERKTKVHNSDRIRARAFLEDPEAQWKSEMLNGGRLRVTRVR